MIDENSFLNKQKSEVEVGKERTKQDAQQELFEKFEMKKTSDFQSALQQGKIELAEEWLNYIIDNREGFSQYNDSWFSDRQKDIDVYKDLKESGVLEKMEHRTKGAAQAELLEKFGFADTKGFRNILKDGDIAKAEEWLDYIVENKLSFPQYLATWDDWLSDRQQELADAKE